MRKNSKAKGMTLLKAINNDANSKNDKNEKDNLNNPEENVKPTEENQNNTTTDESTHIAEQPIIFKKKMGPVQTPWLVVNRNKLLNGILFVIGFVLFALVSFKYYAINQSIKAQRAQIRSHAAALETIIEKSDKLVVATWRDQRENIHFINNPAYKSRNDGELTKAQQIEAEIAKIEEDIIKKTKDVESLREKSSYYTNEIDILEGELAEAKTRILDEGAALGFADTVLREFK